MTFLLASELQQNRIWRTFIKIKTGWSFLALKEGTLMEQSWSLFLGRSWPALKVLMYLGQRVFPHESSSLLYDTKLVMYHATSFQHRTGWSASKECVCASLLLYALPLTGNKTSKYFREAASQAGNSSSWQTESSNRADYKEFTAEKINPAANISSWNVIVNVSLISDGLWLGALSFSLTWLLEFSGWDQFHVNRFYNKHAAQVSTQLSRKVPRPPENVYPIM